MKNDQLTAGFSGRRIAAAMQGVPESIVERQLGHFEKVRPDYAAGVRAALAAKAAIA